MTVAQLLKLKASPGRLALGLLSVMVLALCTGTCAAQEAEPGESVGELKVRQYNILGKTGLKVSDIGFGAGGTTDPALIEYALDMGINYFDTAESYARGQSETAIGVVAAKRRDEMVICTKLDMDGNTTKDDVLTRLDACLERLQTDYVDILMIHGGAREAVENPEIYAAFDELKNQGKIHFTGVSHHGPSIAEEMMMVIEEGKLDVILCSFDPVGDPEIPPMLEAALEKGIGLVAMKVFPSARTAELPEFTSGSQPFHLAALRWALQESGMHCVIVSLGMMDQVDEYLMASGAAQE
jgi:aryl-alcohol dehydrogenase-like predicted oxidoreductase